MPSDPTSSLHDALPIYSQLRPVLGQPVGQLPAAHPGHHHVTHQEVDRTRVLLGDPNRLWSVPRFQNRVATRLQDKDRKSTRLNSSHLGISYAVFCLKKT